MPENGYLVVKAAQTGRGSREVLILSLSKIG
jgi:hypothetical protein